MEYRNLGRTGLKVSEICLGTMTFGLYTDEAEADRMLGLSLDAGLNFVDTANAYIGGKSETIHELGRMLGRYVLQFRCSAEVGYAPCCIPLVSHSKHR